MTDSSFIDRFAERLDGHAEQLPPWTLRCTWRAATAPRELYHTYHGADSEISALDRAVFVLDHFRQQTADGLVRVDVLHPGGWWANVPSSSTHLSPAPASAGLGAGPTG